MIAVRSRRYSFLRLQLLLIAVTVGIAFGGVRVCRAAYLPVYGSPPFIQGIGGYKSNGAVENPTFVASNSPVVVNDEGIAVGNTSRVDASGHTLDYRAVRWNATEATELAHLGTDSQGIAFSGVLDINIAGTAVGGAGVGSEYTFGTRPVRWNVAGTSATELERLGFNSGSRAQAINDAGDAAGSYSTGNPLVTRAALWNSAGTTATVLSLVTGFNISEATGINNAGTIIGQMKKLSPSTDLAVRWDTPGVATLLDHLGLNIPGSTTTIATAISEAGVVAGTSSKHDTSGNPLGTFAVRWAPLGTSATELQNPWTDPNTGQSEAHVTAINPAGTVVGHAERYPGYGPAALLWGPVSTDATILANLGTSSTGAYVSAAFDINAAGYIVGFADKYNPAGLSTGRSAVVWRPDGAVIDLNSLINPTSGWLLTVATSISNTGWIAGYGYYDPDGTGGQQSYPRMFLIHIPEPTSLPCIGISLIHVFLINRRRM